MRREWEPEDLVANCVARQVGVDPGELAGYEWSGRTFEYHRAQIRRALGSRRFTGDDEAKLAGWLADEVAAAETSDDRLRAALLARCRAERVEPPARVDRILGAARAAVADRFTTAVVARLTSETAARLDALAGIGRDGADPGSTGWLAELRADPGKVGRDTVAGELAKLARVRALGLPVGLFAGWPDTLEAAWRARAAVEYPSDLREHPRPVRLTLLAALAWVRQGELVDGLVETQTRPAPGPPRPRSVRSRRTHRRPDRRRVRRHPPHHLPPPGQARPAAHDDQL